MSKTILILLILLSFSFTLNRKRPTKPPGTVQITESFFVDQCEISNLAWREYVQWTCNFYGKASLEYLASLPDTTVWLNKLAYNDPYCAYYFSHPAYNDYPVVGISYEQALAYCKWRTQRVKEFVRLAYKKDWDIEYRLPTKDEWESLYTPAVNIVNISNQKPGFNLLDTASINSGHFDNADVTAPVRSYEPNAFKIYNLIGNVAEMVMEKNICKGGSWRHHPSQSYPGKDIPYEKPEAWLGFRCVCVMKNIKL